jgi:hypothetical protein
MSGSQQAIHDALQRAGAIYAAAKAEQHQIATEGGAEAVAQWAAPGTTDAQRAELAEYWERLQAEQAGGTTAA